MAENSTDQQEKQANPIDENQDFVPKLTGKQKAALVVVSLGSDRASQIYKYLGEHDIEELTFEVAKMGKTTNSMVETTLDQFYRLCLTHKMMTDGGMDYAKAVLEKAFGESAANPFWTEFPRPWLPSPLTSLQREIPRHCYPCFKTSVLRLSP